MGRMSEICLDIEEMLDSGYSVDHVSNATGFSCEAIREFADYYFGDVNDCQEPLFDSQDGDFDSAMESAGFGTDEDYF